METGIQGAPPVVEQSTPPVLEQSTPPVLELKNVTSGYSEDIDIIRNLSLEVPKGEMRGIIGLNGAGKSTLLKTICSFLRPKRGDVRLNGKSLLSVPAHECLREGLFLIPQESSLFPHLTVDANLAIIARATGADVQPVYERFPDLKERRHVKAGNLSGGQQKMVEFGKALLAKPKMLLIDEPSIGLAPQVARQVYQWIEEFSEEGTTILLVDHNIMRVIEMVDYVYVLNLGEISAEGRPEQFRDDLRRQVSTWLGL